MNPGPIFHDGFIDGFSSALAPSMAFIDTTCLRVDNRRYQE